TKPPGGYHRIAERLRVGDVEFRDALVGVSETDFVANQDGLIGTDVFSQFLVTLEFANLSLRLDPLPADEGAGRQPLTRVFRFGHMLLIPARVGDSREALFLIDTGATRTLISYDLAAQVGKVNRDDRVRISGVNGAGSD